MEPGPEVELPHVEALHGALGLSEAGDHGLGTVGEGKDGEVGVEGAEKADNEGLSGGLGEGVDCEDEESGNEGRGEAAGEEVNDEDAGGDEEDGVGGIEREAVGSREVSGDLRYSNLVASEVVEDERFEAGIGGGEEEKSTAGRRVEKDHGGYELREVEPRGEDHESAIWVF